MTMHLVKMIQRHFKLNKSKNKESLQNIVRKRKKRGGVDKKSPKKENLPSLDEVKNPHLPTRKLLPRGGNKVVNSEV